MSHLRVAQSFKSLHKFGTATPFASRAVYLVGGKRTPIGVHGGGLSKLSAKDLGVLALQAAVKSVNIPFSAIDEVIMGHSYVANQGQNTARQVSLAAGVNLAAHCTTVSKMCSSSIKALDFVSMTIAKGDTNVALAGGYESMSNVPYLIPNLRTGYGYGNAKVMDGLHRDGFEDDIVNKSMGELAEKTGKDFKITREQADEYAIRSYERTLTAMKQGWLSNQIVPVKINDKLTISEDEEPKKFNKERMPSLKPAFLKDGILTAGNSSKANDGGVCLVLMNEQKLKELNVKPWARIVSFADAAIDPVDFTIAPAESIKKLLRITGLTVKDIDYWELNEAFAVTMLANAKILGLNFDNVNIHGGAIAQGHPIAFSAGKVVLGLSEVLRMKKGKYGIASVCNAGGGSSSVLLENLQ